jgi:hypothetical protein
MGEGGAAFPAGTAGVGMTKEVRRVGKDISTGATKVEGEGGKGW